MMKNVVTMTCCAIALGVVSLSAQSGTVDKDKMDKGKMDKSMKNGTVMVTGCVAEGVGVADPSAARQSGFSQTVAPALLP